MMKKSKFKFSLSIVCTILFFQCDNGFANTFLCYIDWEYTKLWEVKSYNLTSGNDSL